MNLRRTLLALVAGALGMTLGYRFTGWYLRAYVLPPPIATGRNIVTDEINETVSIITVAEGGHVMGSGTRITHNGHILTCGHLFEAGVTSAMVSNPDGTIEIAELLFADHVRDLALIQVSASTAPVATVAWNSPKQGDKITVVGAPLGLEFSVSEGIVAGLHRSGGPTPDAMQITAHTNPGNSGGPVFNTRGEVVGVVSFVVSDDSPFVTPIGFTVSISSIRAFLDKFRGLDIR